MRASSSPTESRPTDDDRSICGAAGGGGGGCMLQVIEADKAWIMDGCGGQH